MEFKPLYYEDKLDVINHNGHVGIVTLWTKLGGDDGYRNRLRTRYPQLFESDSPLVAITNLYGLGFPQMLANLLYNPQIERIVVTGTNLFKAEEIIFNYFSKGVEAVKKGSVEQSRVVGTEFDMDPQLKPDLFTFKPDLQRFEVSDLEGILNYLSKPRKNNPTEQDRVKIELIMPEFKDYPSDVMNHNVVVATPTEGWMEIMYLLDRYGIDVELEKGKRRTLFNVDVSVLNPIFEDEERLRLLSYDPDELRNYQREILNPKLGDQNYTYGNRQRKYFGIDALEVIVERLRKDHADRHCLVSLWDTGKDLLSKAGDSSSPCFSDAYFVNVNGKLIMTASFRTHNAVSAWLSNLYGMMAIQEFVAERAEMEPGRINVRSRWLSIDPDNAKTVSALNLVKDNRKIKLDVNDPRGFFVVDVEGQEIVCRHFEGSVQLEEFRGKNAKSIKNQLRQASAISNPDHAMWVGYELARAQQKLYGEELGEL